MRRFKYCGMTPCRVVYTYGSIFTNIKGVTSPENILIVITGIRITSHKKYYFLLAAWCVTAKFKSDSHFVIQVCYV
jgi:hypothetical protein